MTYQTEFKLETMKIKDLHEAIRQAKREALDGMHRDCYCEAAIEVLPIADNDRMHDDHPHWFDKTPSMKMIRDELLRLHQDLGKHVPELSLSGNVRIKGDYGTMSQRYDESEPSDEWWNITIQIPHAEFTKAMIVTEAST